MVAVFETETGNLTFIVDRERCQQVPIVVLNNIVEEHTCVVSFPEDCLLGVVRVSWFGNPAEADNLADQIDIVSDAPVGAVESAEVEEFALFPEDGAEHLAVLQFHAGAADHPPLVVEPVGDAGHTAKRAKAVSAPYPSRAWRASRPGY